MKHKKYTIKIFIYYCIICLIFCNKFFLYSKNFILNNEISKKQNLKKEYKTFFEYFEIKDTLFFNQKNLLIGDITNFIYMGKTCVLFDRISDSLFYIDIENKKYKTLTTEDSLPGYHLTILQMIKYDKNEFIVSSDPYYYILFSEGKISRIFKNKNYRASYQFICQNNRLVSYQHPIPSQISLVEINMSTGKFSTLFKLNEVGNNLRNLLFRNTINGGFLYDEKAGFFIANPYENKIYRYNLMGKLTNIYKSNNKKFKMVEQDAAQSTPAAIIEFWRQSKKKPFDMLYSIYHLNENTLLAAYIINKRLYFELFDKDSGKIINDENIIVPFPIKFASDNLLFLERHITENKKDEQIANPYLIKFSYKR